MYKKGDMKTKKKSVNPTAKYNLNPEFQHVKASFMNTEKAVEKMRK